MRYCAFFTLLIASALLFSYPSQGQTDWSLTNKDPEDRTLDDVLESGFIEIGVYKDFPPYSFENEAGEAAGIDIEVGRLIASGLGVEPR
ncbi:MAG: transporter substrate-binding domain-containing protein, partial [Pseudomonadota bacterium]